MNQGTTETLGPVVLVRRRTVTQKAPSWGRDYGGNGETGGSVG
jgi:hypothetical protein